MYTNDDDYLCLANRA